MTNGSELLILVVSLPDMKGSMKIRYEDFDEDNLERLPNLERIPRKPREEKLAPPKEKSKKPRRPKEDIYEINTRD